MNLNSGDSLVSLILCHFYEGMCQQAKYCLGATCGLCSFSGRKSRASFTRLWPHYGPSSLTPCPLHSHCHFTDEEIKTQKH